MNISTGYKFKISIHTPARGVTDQVEAGQAAGVISIHTPARGVTIVSPLISRPLDNFNPHSRKGSDTELPDIGVMIYYFNPHSRKGSDDVDDEEISMENISIHTPARGVTAIFANNHI